jgi:hypothetical protein
MTNLKIQKIVFGDPEGYHFISFNSGDHDTPIVEDRHDIDIEVMVPSSTKLEDVEKIAYEKVKKIVKELAKTL